MDGNITKRLVPLTDDIARMMKEMNKPTPTTYVEEKASDIAYEAVSNNSDKSDSVL
jgi:hypothetical protein